MEDDIDANTIITNISKIPFISEASETKATKSKGKFNIIIYHM